jgi:hypothetical protein
MGLLTALLLPSLLLAAAPPADDSASVEAVLVKARQTMNDLEYDRAASLLTEIIVDQQASLAQQTEARWRLAECEVIRGFNSEARAHYLWLLEHDPTFTVAEDAPPKISGFFRLVRDDWQHRRDQEARLVAAAEREAQARQQTAEAEQAAQAQAEAQRREREQLEQARDQLQKQRAQNSDGAPRAGSTADEVGSPEILSASLVAYAAAALGAVCFCGPGLVILLNAPEAIVASACCLGTGVVAGCAVPQGLGTVFLGDMVGGSRSRWAYVTTLLAALGTFLIGGLLLSVAGAVGIFGLGAVYALTDFNETALNANDANAAAASAVVLAGIVALLFAVIQPLAPIAVYALQGGDAPPLEVAETEAFDDGREAASLPPKRRIAHMRF